MDLRLVFSGFLVRIFLCLFDWLEGSFFVDFVLYCGLIVDIFVVVYRVFWVFSEVVNQFMLRFRTCCVISFVILARN